MDIWCNYSFRAALIARIEEELGGRHRFLFVPGDNEGIPPRRRSDDPAAWTADILWGQPEQAALLENDRLRWAEITSAGYTAYDRDEVRATLKTKEAALTNASGVFDEACAQHLAAMMLALARELPRCLDNQRGPRAWLHGEPRFGRRALLNGQTVFIYGYGAIAKRLVEILRPLGLNIHGVRRTVRGDEAVPMLTEAEADARLGEADHLVDILPANEGTRHFFGESRFARCKQGVRFYNIGRGTTVDQSALVAALQTGRVNEAYLDVMDPEPLPPEHPLWSTPRCYLTPHLAGTHSSEEDRLVEHFLANLRAFEAGQALVDRIM